jgi:tripeptide aminopeptidase
MKEVNIKPLIKPIRGGTDGYQLSYKELCLPKYFAGGHIFTVNTSTFLLKCKKAVIVKTAERLTTMPNFGLDQR